MEELITIRGNKFMLTLNSNILKIGNKWILPVDSGGVVPPEPTVYQVTTSATHGTVTASPTEGTTGTEIALSNTPDTGYEFDSYTITGTGATLSGNTLTIGTSDVSVVGNFVASMPSVTYDSYRLVITPISKTYDVPIGGSGSSDIKTACCKKVAGTTVSSISIRNLSRTATAGGIMIDSYTVTNFTSNELSAMASASGYTSAVTNGKGYTVNLEGGSLSRLSFEVNATLASNSYELAVQLLGCTDGSNTVVPLAYKAVSTGQYNSVSLTTYEEKYIDYRFIYEGSKYSNQSYGASGMKVNGLTLTPITAMAYQVYSTQGIYDESHMLSSAEIANLCSTNSLSYYTMPTQTDQNSYGTFVLCCITDTLPSSVSITELGTDMSNYNYYHYGSLYIMHSYISSSNYFIISNVFPADKSNTNILVSSWPKTMSVSI